MGNFRNPDFSSADLEFRFEGEIICIYGTNKGLKALSEVCNKLIKNPSEGHIHFDKNLSPVKLTEKSKQAAVAIFTG